MGHDLTQYKQIDTCSGTDKDIEQQIDEAEETRYES